MSQSVDLYGTAYGNFATHALEQVRRETYREDFGQSSWITGLEYRRFFLLLALKATDHVLDVGCGSGGPALFLAREIGCRVTGVDINEAGIRAGLALAREAGMQEKVHFQHTDVREPLRSPIRRSMPSLYGRDATSSTVVRCSRSGAASCGPAAAYSTPTQLW
jgi:2-polyprenyl-3-methyl-5-hydroxy-6-metoxy-1,4-benzoquinol methylase